MINVSVEKGANENTASLIRRFTKKMQSAGIVKHIRKQRYFARAQSENTKKRQVLKRIDRREKYAELFKLGKLPEKTQKGTSVRH